MPDLLRRLTAEFIGIFAICFVGILAITHGGIGTTGELVGIAFAFGLTVAVMVAALGGVSGAHFNPAVTLAFAAAGKFRLAEVAPYIAAQLAGAAAASGLLAALYGPEAVGHSCTVLSQGVSVMQGFTMEAIATFFLMFIIWGTAVNPAAPKGLFPWAIGLTVTLDILAIGPLTGASLNPARSFGPALASGVWDQHWLYWVAPILGAVLAALLCRSLFATTATATA